MDKEEYNEYKLLVNSATGLMRNFVLLGIAIFLFIVYINNIYSINSILNICFMFPICLIFFSSIILLSLCLFKISFNKYRKNRLISNLIMVSCITFYTFLLLILLYFILTIIFYIL